MAKKRNPARKIAQPKCSICAEPMRIKTIIPAAHIFPELKTFQCRGCGNLRTVEDIAELATPEVQKAAA
ncbi:MAG TPA: hypothetical protein VD863_01755 [Bradyrhizobium sp.]|nr:hypothetical protein [Bradyrhizobium sp.]